MSAMLAKMNWMEERQKVLAQNVANADTPNYQPMDVKPLDFKNLLQSSTSKASLGAATASLPAPGLAVTNPMHIASGGNAGLAGKSPVEQEKNPYEVSPAGNAVILEEQLVKMNQTYMDYQFTSNLYQKNIDIIKEAIK
jgi:flagellar basal-body rod protein FlgB